MQNELVKITKDVDGYVEYSVVCRVTGNTLYTDGMSKQAFDNACAMAVNGFDICEECELVKVNTIRTKNITVTHIRALAKHFNIVINEDKILRGSRLFTMYNPKGTDLQMDSKQFREWVASNFKPFKFQTN